MESQDSLDINKRLSKVTNTKGFQDPFQSGVAQLVRANNL